MNSFTLKLKNILVIKDPFHAVVYFDMSAGILQDRRNGEDMMQDMTMPDLPDRSSSISSRRSSRIRAASSAPSESFEKSSSPNDAASRPPQDGHFSDADLGPKRTQPTRTTKLSNGKSENGPRSDPFEEAMVPLTEEERCNWPGWVELESDPVSTNYLFTGGITKHSTL